MINEPCLTGKRVWTQIWHRTTWEGWASLRACSSSDDTLLMCWTHERMCPKTRCLYQSTQERSPFHSVSCLFWSIGGRSFSRFGDLTYSRDDTPLFVASGYWERSSASMRRNESLTFLFVYWACRSESSWRFKLWEPLEQHTTPWWLWLWSCWNVLVCCRSNFGFIHV